MELDTDTVADTVMEPTTLEPATLDPATMEPDLEDIRMELDSEDITILMETDLEVTVELMVQVS